MLVEEFFEDNIENLITKLGSDVDPTIHKVSRDCPQDIVEWYSNGGLAEKICTFWARQMGTGINIEISARNDNPLNSKRAEELAAWVESEIDRLNIIPLFVEAETQCAVSNAAPMVILTSGEEMLFQSPLVFDSIDKIVIIDPLYYMPGVSLMPYRGGVDLPSVEYFYNRQSHLALHRDRILPLQGKKLLSVESSHEELDRYWGRSLIGSAVLRACIAYEASIKYAEMLIAKKNFIAMGLKGFEAGMKAGESEDYARRLIKSMKLIEKAANILSVHLYDAEDKLDTVERNLSGVKDMIEQIKYHLLAQCPLIPEIKLFGRQSIGGLSTATNEEEDVDGEASKRWIHRWLPLIRHIVKLLLMSGDCPVQGYDIRNVQITRVRGYNSSPIDDANARLLVAQAIAAELANENAAANTNGTIQADGN